MSYYLTSGDLNTKLLEAYVACFDQLSGTCIQIAQNQAKKTKQGGMFFAIGSV